MPTDVYMERMHEVHEWQRFYQMEPRDDSRLTVLFCSGKLPSTWTADGVARELMATDFIYKNTLYGELIEEFMREVAARIRQTYNLSWDETWNIVRFYAPAALKLLSLERCGLSIPQSLARQEDVSS